MVVKKRIGTNISTTIAPFFNPEWAMVLYIIFVSLAANIFFYFTLASRAVGFGDSWSRLNIARRVVDSLTPGIAQLGGIWLPFPQILITPFAAIDPLYYSGIAPMFISSPAFILGGWYLFRLLRLLSGSAVAAVVGTLVYASNVNLLYIQTTSMSEPLFLCAVLGALYHFLRWKSSAHGGILSLVISAGWTFIATLTRYEGFFLLIIFTFSVVVAAIGRKKTRTYVEGMITLFVTLAGFGVFIWFIYSWVIFGHPLNWLHIYTGKIAVISTVSEKPTQTWGVSDFKYDLTSSIRSIVESSFQMNGLLLVVPVVITFIYYPMFVITQKNKSLTNTLSVLIASAPLIFYIVSSFGGSALIRNPPMTIAMLTDPTFHTLQEYNIRYGLMTLPFILVLSTILWRVGFLRVIFIGIALSQVILFFTGWPTTIYNFPKRYLTISKQEKLQFQQWFRTHYDGGLILASAIANDQLMYSLKIPYKSYIYEGTGKYWKQAVADPTTLARWVMYQNGPKVTNTGGSADFVSYYLQDAPVLTDNYNLVYTDDRIVVYKIKEHT